MTALIARIILSGQCNLAAWKSAVAQACSPGCGLGSLDVAVSPTHKLVAVAAVVLIAGVTAWTTRFPSQAGEFAPGRQRIDIAQADARFPLPPSPVTGPLAAEDGSCQLHVYFNGLGLAEATRLNPACREMALADLDLAPLHAELD